MMMHGSTLTRTVAPKEIWIGNSGTADLFTIAVQIHEKHEWWLRDMLETRDGLTV